MFLALSKLDIIKNKVDIKFSKPLSLEKKYKVSLINSKRY